MKNKLILTFVAFITVIVSVLIVSSLGCYCQQQTGIGVNYVVAASEVQAQTPAFDTSNFSNPLEINNKYFPLKPGTTMIYEGKNEDEPTRDVFVVTNDTKEIMGITTRIVHDDAYVNEEHEETTNDWFAQDDQGNVAKAGIVMEADPKVDDTYNQEFLKGVAEDKGTILSLDEKITVPYGTFPNVLKTKDFSPLEPDIVENKYYAQNIGEIKALSVKGESEVESLVQINGTGNSNSSDTN